ncbi:hypothetical protein [Bacillus bombysepticus]|uniref:hypothetical protein n=1 Tax=Bacillus bombysepticus TaxID=658666 RepID=UPI00301B3677
MEHVKPSLAGFITGSSLFFGTALFTLTTNPTNAILIALNAFLITTTLSLIALWVLRPNWHFGASILIGMLSIVFFLPTFLMVSL